MQLQDVATLVSVLPRTITETKPGLIPSTFVVEGVPNWTKDFSLCYIGYNIKKKEYHDIIHYIYIDEDRGTFVAYNRAIEVANAVINDYVVAKLCQDNDARPGMFAVQGKFTKEEIEKQFSEQLAEARARQRNWLVRLLKLADDDWARTHQHKMISDDQRYAATALNEEREWLFQDAKSRCPACRTVVDDSAILCRACNYIIDPAKYDPSRFIGGVAKPAVTKP